MTSRSLFICLLIIKIVCILLFMLARLIFEGVSCGGDLFRLKQLDKLWMVIGDFNSVLGSHEVVGVVLLLVFLVRSLKLLLMIVS